MRLLLTALVFCLMSSQVVAQECWIFASKASDDELIANSKRIVLARLISAEYVNDEKLQNDYICKRRVDYKFQSLEVIKGDSPNEFVIRGRVICYERDLEDYYMHKKNPFWESVKSGRALNQKDCGEHFESGTAFAVGADYLIIDEGGDDAFPHSKNAELISNAKQDKWLQYVREKVNEQTSELSNE